jgi:FAD/FMN-containing dehydrogenase
MAIEQTHIDALKDILGPKGYADQDLVKAIFLVDCRGEFLGVTPLIAMPKSVAEVQTVVKYCATHKIEIVPQGGNTGLVGASIPNDTGDQILLSMGRMNKVLSVDALDYSCVVEAGATLYDTQQAASEKDRLFAVSLASEGTCQIGGNISTNAGGIHVLGFGSMREQVLGLEVVLPNGDLWSNLQSLRKDNAGYDMKHLFIGAEGTLGIITKAVLKLHPRPRTIKTVALGLDSLEHTMKTLARLREDVGAKMVAFEVFTQKCLDLAIKNIEGVKSPFETNHVWYGLIELWGGDDVANMDLDQLIMGYIEDGLLETALPAQNGAQRKAFWHIRENLSVAQKPEGGAIKHDISIAPGELPEFYNRAETMLSKKYPGIRIVAFGHAGDGNLHYDLCCPEGTDPVAFMANRTEIQHHVHAIATDMGGSIAAEHGIGRIKRDALHGYKSDVDLNMMKAIKKALDPDNIMNPNRAI